MKLIKYLFALFAIVASVSIHPSALGVDDLPGSIFNGTTSNQAATSTNSYTTNVVFYVPYSTDISIQPSFKLQGAGTSAVVFVFDTSLDGSIWYDSAFTISITPAGTEQKSKVTSTALGSTPWVRLSSIQNPNATAVTNLLIKATSKRGL